MPRKWITTLVLAVAALGAAAWMQSLLPTAAAQSPTPKPEPTAQPTTPPSSPGSPPTMQPGPPPNTGGFQSAWVDSFAAERDSLAQLVMQKIAGRENAPAESVFKNIKVMQGTPAGQLVRIMNMGYGRSLGASCDFCHTENHWADDDKKEKAVARDMIQMAHAINADLVPKMKSLEGERVFINCSTCHQGHHKPPRLGGPPRGGPPPGGGGGH